MPRIFDNIDQKLLPALKDTLHVVDHFSVDESDFITNYDIKYRMGRDSGEEA